MQKTSLAIIGAGNMGSALLGGLISNGYPADRLWITDPDSKKLTALEKQYSVNTVTNNILAVQSADTVILAVKPQHMRAVAKEIANAVQTTKCLVISIAAGIRTQSLQHWLGPETHIIRCMPNTPALIGCGATALFAGSHVTANECDVANQLLQATGLTVRVDREELMDTVTALSGSGPAYFFYFLGALEKAATALGLPPETAHRLATQTALGAARMAIDSPTPVSELQRQVTSPGGTTEAAIRVFDENHLESLLARALSAAQHRSEELAESFDAN